MRIVLRVTGWLLIVASAVVGLYLVYALYWTGLAAARSQEVLRESFQQQVGQHEVGDAGRAAPASDLGPQPSAYEHPTAVDPLPLPAAVAVGEPVAVLEFFRPRDGEPVVLDQPVVVVEGVTREALATGPGRYPGTAHPGWWGNFAVAGHRTTYGAPFFELDQLQRGDEIHVTGRDGTVWVYAFVDARIVAPGDTSVLAEDPLGRDRPMLTLTTCHPRWSQAQRLVVFAELADGQLPAAPRA